MLDKAFIVWNAPNDVVLKTCVVKGIKEIHKYDIE